MPLLAESLAHNAAELTGYKDIKAANHRMELISIPRTVCRKLIHLFNAFLIFG